MSCSVISDTVLRCRPETRANSAREMGCRRRIRFRMTPRLIARAVSLDATSVLVKLVRRIKVRGLLYSTRGRATPNQVQDHAATDPARRFARGSRRVSGMRPRHLPCCSGGSRNRPAVLNSRLKLYERNSAVVKIDSRSSGLFSS